MLTSSRMSNRYVFAGAGIARPPTFGLRNALRVRGRTLCAPTGGIPSQSPPHHSKPVFFLSITFQGHLACPIFTQKTAPYPIKSGVQHRFFLSYSINSIIMLCAFCACSPIRQALSPAQNRSLPSPQSGQTNRPHKQSAGFSGQAGQCPGALSRSSA